jgi:hypothetical protein
LLTIVLHAFSAHRAFPVIWSIVKGWIDPITRAKIHVIKGDPSSFLSKYISPEHLPKEYGGTCNTCPNSPDCCKQYPLEAALALLPLRESDLQLTDVTVKAGKSVAVKHDLKPNEVVEWFWKLDDKDDIDFSVVFQPEEAESKVRCAATRAHIICGCGMTRRVAHSLLCLAPSVSFCQPITIVAPARIVSWGHGGQGSWRCSTVGTVSITFDNSFSYFTSKRLKHFTRVTDRMIEATVEAAEERARKEGASSSSTTAASPTM